MADVVRKFGQRENPGGRIHIPHLLKFELEHQQPALPIEQFLKEDFYFNSDLAKPPFPFLEEDKGNMAKWEAMIATQVEEFQQSTSALPIWFPELQGFPPSGPVAVIDALMQKVGN